MGVKFYAQAICDEPGCSEVGRLVEVKIGHPIDAKAVRSANVGWDVARESTPVDSPAFCPKHNRVKES